jgi:hypothetical protein
MCGREEIQRIKAAKPDIQHREAFSMAAKNVRHIVFTSSVYLIYLSNNSIKLIYMQWAKCDPRCSSAVSASNSTPEPRVVLPGPQVIHQVN